MEYNVSTQPKIRMTPAEYLAQERKAEVRSEFINGEMFEMPGVSRKHGRIVINVIVELEPQLRDRPCEMHAVELRVKIPETESYLYPDIFIVDGEPEVEDEHQDTVLNPRVLIEVLSPSTESYDRGLKFAHYRKMASLQEYILVSQTECRVERYLRQDDGTWIYSETTDPAGFLELASLGCRIPLSGIYRKVEFEPSKNRPIQ